MLNLIKSLIFLVSWPLIISSQQNLVSPNKRTHYQIFTSLDHSTHSTISKTTLSLYNSAFDSITELRFYMYLNSFKNFNSSFLIHTNEIFGRDISKWKPDEMGWIQIDSIFCINSNSREDLSNRMAYIQPDDGNVFDESVLNIPLTKSIPPGREQTFEIYWRSKMPKTIARMGYRQNFYLFCHWFPQLGVFERNKYGNYEYNCHQAFRNTEFYSEFADYEVTIECDTIFKLGSSGVIQAMDKVAGTNKNKYLIEAQNVIDFTWSIDPNFAIFKDQWKDVQINLLLPQDYKNQAERFLNILKFAMAYFEEHLASYPYPSITVVCPPFHALQSGLMEYPTLITTGSFYAMPENIRFTESLLVHEFSHQFFMAIIATNEKESPWMDEAFATYFEDRIIDSAFGNNKSLINLFGFQFGNVELTRNEYVRLSNPAQGITARPGWVFDRQNYKGLIYSKPAITFHSISRIIGQKTMDLILKLYYQKWQFGHPKECDLLDLFSEGLNKYTDNITATKINTLLYESLYTSKTMDYQVMNINHEKSNANNTLEWSSTIELQNKGDWNFPVEILVEFENGEAELYHWLEKTETKTIKIIKKFKVSKAYIDPDQKLLMDLDLNNNKMQLAKETNKDYSVFQNAIYWVESLLFFFGNLI